MTDKSAFGFDLDRIDNWDARETGQALKTVLAKAGKLTRTTGNDDQIRGAIGNDPDALSGLEHLREVMRSPVGAGSGSDR